MILVRWLILVALAVSSAQFADYLTEVGTFCPFEGDCEAVTNSVYGRPLGVPLSAIGLVAFATLFTLTLLPDGRAFRLLRPLAIAGGVVAVALLVIQFAVLQRVCPLCLVVDACSVALAVTVFVRRPVAVPPVRLKLVGWIVAGIAAVIVPMVWSASEIPPPVPEQVKAYWEPGRVTVVEVTDFDCPHCRTAEAVLKEVLPRHDVKFVRLPVAMAKNENARPAAVAFLAAAKQGKGEEMAAFLFKSDVRSAPRCRELANHLGLNLEEYDRAVNDVALADTLAATMEWSRNLGTGLPLLFVQETPIQGVPNAAKLDLAIRRAKPYQP